MSSRTTSRRLPIHAPCRSADQLWRWIKQHLELTIPRHAVCPGHSAPFDYLRSAYFEPASDLVVWAPRGGGKTRLGAAATLLDLLHKPGVSVRILGGSLEQSLRMWEHLLPDLERVAEKKIAGKPRARRVALESGAVAAVVTQSQRSVRGLRVQKLRCDEVDLFDPEVWEAAQLVTRSRDQDGKRVAGTIEALSTFHQSCGLMEKVIDRALAERTPVLHWCLMEVLEKCPPDRDCATCPLHSDCAGRAKQLCEGFVAIEDAISLKRRVSLENWETEMLCRRLVTRGRVFPTFDPAIHVVESMPAPPGHFRERAGREGLYLGIDFGFVNPFACLWIVRDRYNRTFVIDEYIEPGKLIDQHIEAIKARGHGMIRRIGCDPAGKATNDQTGLSNVAALRKHWKVRCKSSRIIDGLEMIRADLRSAAGDVRLFIHPRCVKLIMAMRSLRHPDEHTETPLKDGVHDHPADALRYHYITRESEPAEGGWY